MKRYRSSSTDPTPAAFFEHAQPHDVNTCGACWRMDAAAWAVILAALVVAGGIAWGRW